MPGAIIFEFPELFLIGFWFTVQLSVLGIFFSLVLGTVVALLRVSPLAVLRWIGASYVEFFRNTPLLVQLFFMWLGLGALGFRWWSTDTFQTIFRAAIASMALYHAAYVGEIIRGGLIGVDKGQLEAARSLGLSYPQMLRFVQLPETFRSIIPPLGNISIALIKNTSLAATIGVAELLNAAEIVESRTFRAEEAFGAVVLLYLVLTIPASLVVNTLERRLLIAR